MDSDAAKFTVYWNLFLRMVACLWAGYAIAIFSWWIASLAVHIVWYAWRVLLLPLSFKPLVVCESESEFPLSSLVNARPLL